MLKNCKIVYFVVCCKNAQLSCICLSAFKMMKLQQPTLFAVWGCLSIGCFLCTKFLFRHISVRKNLLETFNTLYRSYIFCDIRSTIGSWNLIFDSIGQLAERAAQFLTISGRGTCVRILASNFYRAKVCNKSLLPGIRRLIEYR